MAFKLIIKTHNAMTLLTREQFVQICTDAILYTRDTITIANQLSGYKKYHGEIKENWYDESMRKYQRENIKNIVDTHKFLAHVGLGRCHELADFLLVEIGNRIERKGAAATLKIVSSRKADHIYVHVQLRLADEIKPSCWEVDAWDPRIIDISRRPDYSIKNIDFLDYGVEYNTLLKIQSYQLNYNANINFSFIDKPQPGPPGGDATPERQMTKKHEWLYSDHTVEEAIQQGKIASSGKLHYLQKVSTWQRPSFKKEKSKKTPISSIFTDKENKINNRNSRGLDQLIDTLPEECSVQSRSFSP